MYQNNDLGVLCFSTESDLRNLASCNIVYVDGTFKSTPRPYKQIFTVHDMYLGHCAHLVTCLLTGKPIAHYTVVLSANKERILQITGVEWQPTEFFCDFEQAIIASVEDEFPLAGIDGYYFHFTNNLWKEARDLGLSIPYINNEDLKRVKCYGVGVLATSFCYWCIPQGNKQGICQGRIVTVDFSNE